MRTKTFGGCKTCERPQQRDPFPTPFPLLSHSFPTPSPRSTVATVTATNNSPPHSLLHFDAGAEFEGGGTYFEHDDSTHQIGKGDCLVHSGKLRHSGVAITSGRRCETSPSCTIRGYYRPLSYSPAATYSPTITEWHGKDCGGALLEPGGG